MESIPFFLIFRLLAGFAAGIWLARKMQGFFRWLVMRLMPLRYRISEQAFYTQARIGAALAYLLALSVALLTYAGLGKAANRLGLPWVTKEEVTEVRSLSLEPTLPPSYSTAVLSPPEQAAPWKDSFPASAVAPPQPGAPEPERTPFYPTAYRRNGRYYAQLYAFREEARAWAQKEHWQARLSEPVWVGVAAGEAVPYKVLVGPFGQRQEARRFLRGKGLNGFPREQGNIRLYKD